jgi:hypothetical protein
MSSMRQAKRLQCIAILDPVFDDLSRLWGVVSPSWVWSGRRFSQSAPRGARLEGALIVGLQT